MQRQIVCAFRHQSPFARLSVGAKPRFGEPCRAGRTNQLLSSGQRNAAKGHTSFILNYRLRTGRQRRLTIGSWPVWTLTAARQAAAELRRKIDMGKDPLGERTAAREAPTVKHLAARAEAEYFPKLRPGTQRGYRAFLKNDIAPPLGGLKVAEVSSNGI